jgi:hypothetical protein
VCQQLSKNENWARVMLGRALDDHGVSLTEIGGIYEPDNTRFH